MSISAKNLDSNIIQVTVTTMASDTYEDAVSVVNHLKNRIAVAAAFVMVKFAKREGVSAVNYTRSFQNKHITENQDKLDPILEQRFLRHCQDEVLDKLRKAIPKPSVHSEIMDSFEDDSSLDWFDEWCNASQPKRRKENMFQSEQRVEFQTVFSVEKCALKNLQFVESMMRISEESESTNPVSVSELQTLLYDEAENFNQFRDSPTKNSKSFSEDSGLGTSEEAYSEIASCNVNFISGGAVRFALQSSNATQLISNSVRSVVNFVKNEIKTKPVEVFNSWRGSIIESSCDVLNKYARKSANCRELMLNMVFELIEDVWCDRSMAQQEHWEKKTYIVNEMLAKSENCYEVLQFISDKADYFMQCLKQKHKNVPVMTEKLNYLLDLYACVCENTRVARSKSPVEVESAKPNTEESDVTTLWQEKWCVESGKDKDGDGWISEIKDNQIAILERLTIQTFSKYPLLSTKAVAALQGAKQLCSDHGT